MRTADTLLTPFLGWLQGLNEQINVLSRQLFPKDKNLKIMKTEILQKMLDLINI